ncbi:MAG: hypothetical protein HOW73_17320 [Polyangiaceae bacterium]|nr:hypothetical protein [Polyangiaceae bacterium]
MTLMAFESQEGRHPVDDSTLDDRMKVGWIGTVIAFAVIVAGLVYSARRLARLAKKAEDEERLATAFREIDEALTNQNDEVSRQAPPPRPARPAAPARPGHVRRRG